MNIPIISVVGHVDVGKTSFLDYFSTNKTKESNWYISLQRKH